MPVKQIVNERSSGTGFAERAATFDGRRGINLDSYSECLDILDIAGACSRQDDLTIASILEESDGYNLATPTRDLEAVGTPALTSDCDTMAT